jgi:protein-S-isoprenylcysteine O-methyltransferase Ste14
VSDEKSGGGGNRWLTALASLAVGAAFFALWFWLLPRWLGFSVEAAGAARWRWLAAVPSVVGFAVAVRCIWDFGWTGHGTPAPIAPPQRLVVVGFYRYVRNPMYVGFAAGNECVQGHHFNQRGQRAIELYRLQQLLHS